MTRPTYIPVTRARARARDGDIPTKCHKRHGWQSTNARPVCFKSKSDHKTPKRNFCADKACACTRARASAWRRQLNGLADD
jgi:hypothetical protein